jgi:hypothetical protein
VRYPGTFEVIFDSLEPFQFPAVAKLEFCVIAESRGVVARECMRVTERLQYELQ